MKTVLSIITASVIGAASAYFGHNAKPLKVSAPNLDNVKVSAFVKAFKGVK